MQTPFLHRTDTHLRVHLPINAVQKKPGQASLFKDDDGAADLVSRNTLTWPKRDHAEHQERLFEANARTVTKQLKSGKPDASTLTLKELASGLATADRPSSLVPSAPTQEPAAALSTPEQPSVTSTTAPPDLKIVVMTPAPAPLEHKIAVDSSSVAPAEDDADWHTDPRTGLDEAEAKARLIKYGYNEITEHKVPGWRKFLSYFTGSISYLIEIAIILSGALQV